jgi:hypothetical protein
MAAPTPQLLQAAAKVDVSIAQLAPGLLVRRAISHYNSRLGPGDRRATIESSAPFLQRLCVNFLRHTGSNYDAHRNSIRATGGQALSDSVGLIVRERVLAEIARSYGWLAEEAQRQAQTLTDGQHSQRAKPGRPNRRLNTDATR